MQSQTERRERPILFSGPMVRAIRAGAKTQTRRVVRFRLEGPVVRVTEHGPFRDQPANLQAWSADHEYEGGIRVEQGIRCPYGLVGDRLWVREAFYCDHIWVGDYAGTASCDGLKVDDRAAIEEKWRSMLYYGADGPLADQEEWAEETPGLRPSIFMPRWASRLLLEVEAVRLERLDDTISNHDLRAEGAVWVRDEAGEKVGALPYFRSRWNELNDERGAPWSARPWVWVVTFRRIDS